MLDSVSVPDFISSTQKSNALNILVDRVRFLDAIEPSCMAIACNTAHVFLDALQSASKTHFISMIEEVAKSVDSFELKKVGIMGTPVTIKSMLYQRALSRLGIEAVEPTRNELEILELIIRKVIAGAVSKSDESFLLFVANRLMSRGAEGIILGCTELPLIFPKDHKMPIFNSLEILAKALLRKYYKFNTIREKS